VLFQLPPGGFISLAIWLLTFATYRERKAARERKALKQLEESMKSETEKTTPVAVHA
jgi:hypothetical protein